jgi:hypothetical protein
VSVAAASAPTAAASRPASVAGAEGGSSGLGPSRTPTAVAVAVSFVAVSVTFTSASTAAALRTASLAAASRPASLAGAECGSSGLDPPRAPATAAVVVFFVAGSFVTASAPAAAALRPRRSRGRLRGQRLAPPLPPSLPRSPPRPRARFARGGRGLLRFVYATVSLGDGLPAVRLAIRAKNTRQEHQTRGCHGGLLSVGPERTL